MGVGMLLTTADKGGKPVEFKMPYHRNPVVKKVWWDKDGNLCWKIDQQAKKKVLRGKFVKDLVLLTHQPDRLLELLPKFVQKYGPLWSGDCIGGLDALSNLWTFACIAPIIDGFRLPGVPPSWAQAYADTFLFKALEKWDPEIPILILPRGFLKNPKEGLSLAQALHAIENAIGINELPRRKYLLWRPPYPLAHDFPFVAVEDSPEFWPRFHIPKKPLNTWEKKKDWFITELGWNVSQFLHENIEFYPAMVMDSKHGGMGHASICVKCKDAFTFAVASLVFEWRFRKCPVCGKPAAGSTCGSPRCMKENLWTAPKQRVLNYLYRQKARDKISEEQYEFCKEKADEFFREDEIEDPRSLIREVVASMKEKWPNEDFSFILKGFGSRTRKTSK